MDQTFCLKRCSYSSTVGETVANMEELLTEILVRLPARPLVRFKCVSKRWLSLISSPKFCHRHTLRNPHPSISAIFTNSSSHFYFITLDQLDHDVSSANHGNQRLSGSAGSGPPICNPLNFVPHLYHTYIVQSCNGLFLCLPNPPTSNPPSINHPYYVLNPTTNQFSALVPPAAAAATTHRHRIFAYALAFDPSKSPHYKVVFLWSVDEPEDKLLFNALQSETCLHSRIEIYSSETQSWRLLDSCFIRHQSVNYRNGVYCNGAVHWVGTDGELSYYHIDEERVGFVNAPPLTSEDSLFSRHFWESHGGGHLHLIDVYRLCNPFEVLEMGKDYSGWFVKYRVDLNPIFTADPEFSPYYVIPLFIAREETQGEDSSSLWLHIPGKVISYNLKSNTLKYLKLPPETGGDDSCIRVNKFNSPYMESLACV